MSRQPHYVFIVLQRFRDGREKVVATRPTRARAKARASAIASDHADIYGEGHTRVVRRTVRYQARRAEAD